MSSVELAVAYLERLDRYVALADSKATTTLATIAFVSASVVGLSAARFLGEPPFGGNPIRLDAAGWYLLAAGASLGFSLYALVSAAGVLTPRVKRAQTTLQENPFFFGAASSMSFDEFDTRLTDVSDAGIVEQCYQLARVVDRKMRAARHASIGLYMSIALAAVTAGLILSP